jgi:hypothetical protein
MRDEPAVEVDRLRDHPRLGALPSYAGQVLFMTATAFVVARTTHGQPEVVAVADALAGSTFIIGIPMVLLTAVHWRTLTLARRDEQGLVVDFEATSPARPRSASGGAATTDRAAEAVATPSS